MSKDEPHRQELNSAESLANIRFLVVDDHLVNQEMLRYFIESFNGIATLAGDGDQALKKVKEETFDVIIMDIQMPEMNGLEATAEIRKLPDGANIPIIGLSANAMVEDIKECYSAGMNDFIPKPLDFKNFIEIVTRCLNSSKANKNINALQEKKNNVQTEQMSDKNKPLDIEAYVNRMGGNREISMIIIRGFIEEIPDRLENIAAAIKDNSKEVIHREAHSIKGGAANVFAHDLMNAAKKLELNAHSAISEYANELLEDIINEYKRVSEFWDKNKI